MKARRVPKRRKRPARRTPSQAEKLRAELLEWKRQDKLKDEFISVISHELRTPLAIVKGAIGNLKDGIMGALPEAQGRVLEIASRNIERLARLINDLLDLSRLESGRAKINRRWIQLPHLVEESLHVFQGVANERKISLRAQSQGEIPQLYADSDLLMQLLNNLVQNSVRFAKGCAIVTLKPWQTGVQLTVSDDGPGISAEDQERLFTKFQQLDRPMGGAGSKGTGLGLAICREIARLHHGEIWVESEPGHGAAFHVTLPHKDEDDDFWADLQRLLVAAEQKKRPVSIVLFSRGQVETPGFMEALRLRFLRRMDFLLTYPSRGEGLIVADTDAAGAKVMLKRLREMTFPDKVSAGVATFPDEGRETKALLDLARGRMDHGD